MGNGRTPDIEYRALAHGLSDQDQLRRPSSIFGDTDFKPVARQHIQVLQRH